MGTGNSCGIYGTDGLQYQCVEYVRRFYRIAKGVDTTTAQWKGNAKAYFSSAQARGLVAHQNNGTVPPRPDDILVFIGGEYGHVAIVTEVTENRVTFIEQNASDAAVRSLSLSRPDGNYSISAWGHYAVVGWLRLPETTVFGTVRTTATLNGQPFSGSVNFNIVGPNGVIIGLGVPGETSNLPPGQYTFVYQNGGPPNGTLTSITPSAQQTLPAGGDITFSMNFSSQSYQWLSFIEGNPGIPGDGIFTNAAGGNNSFDFDLNPPIPMSQFPDGYTLTVFPPGSQTFNNPQFTISTPNRPPPCTVSFGSGVPAPSGTITVNGVLGFYSVVQQFHIQGNVDFANQVRPGCNFVLNDLYMSRLGLNRIGIPTNVTTIDAVAIGAGPNNTP